MLVAAPGLLLLKYLRLSKQLNLQLANKNSELTPSLLSGDSPIKLGLNLPSDNRRLRVRGQRDHQQRSAELTVIQPINLCLMKASLSRVTKGSFHLKGNSHQNIDYPKIIKPQIVGLRDRKGGVKIARKLRSELTVELSLEQRHLEMREREMKGNHQVTNTEQLLPLTSLPGNISLPSAYIPLVHV